jgi:uncharacterized protein (DUF433 family)
VLRGVEIEVSLPTEAPRQHLAAARAPNGTVATKTASPAAVACVLAQTYTDAMTSPASDLLDEHGVSGLRQHASPPESSRALLLASSPDATAITMTAGICGGRACIAGARITVWGLVSHRNLGLDERAILATVPRLTSDQLAAAFRYAEENAEEIAHDLAENETGE